MKIGERHGLGVQIKSPRFIIDFYEIDSRAVAVLIAQNGGVERVDFGEIIVVDAFGDFVFLVAQFFVGDPIVDAVRVVVFAVHFQVQTVQQGIRNHFGADESIVSELHKRTNFGNRFIVKIGHFGNAEKSPFDSIIVHERVIVKFAVEIFIRSRVEFLDFLVFQKRANFLVENIHSVRNSVIERKSGCPINGFRAIAVNNNNGRDEQHQKGDVDFQRFIHC